LGIKGKSHDPWGIVSETPDKNRAEAVYEKMKKKEGRHLAHLEKSPKEEDGTAYTLKGAV